MPAAVETSRLRKSFGDVHALRGLDAARALLHGIPAAGNDVCVVARRGT